MCAAFFEELAQGVVARFSEAADLIARRGREVYI